MRTEVQEILDKEWPDQPHRGGRNIRYGVYNMSSALVRLAMHAEDIGDNELHEDAIEQARMIVHPESKPGAKKPRMINALMPHVHSLFHSTEQMVLLFKEKHGTWRFVADNATEMSLAVLTMLEQRLNEDCYMDELYDELNEVDPPDINQLDIFKDNTPPQTDKQRAAGIIAFARSGDAGALIKAGKWAYTFLQNRDDYEYEGIDVEYADEATFDLTSS